MKTQLKWRHRNIPYVCTYFTPGFLAPGGTIFQHTVHDALRFFTSIALITCCAILISALYFTLPLSLAASHRTLNESSRTRIKLEILYLVFSSLSLLLHSVYNYALRSVFFFFTLYSVFTHVESRYAILLRQKKGFTYEKSTTPTGLVWDTNMAANMADVRSYWKALFLKNCYKKKPCVLSCAIGEKWRTFYLLLAFVIASNSLPLPRDLSSILDKV